MLNETSTHKGGPPLANGMSRTGRPKGPPTANWTNRVRHGLHQIADLLAEVVVDVVESARAASKVSSRPAHGRRRRTPPAASSPPDDIVRARAQRILRDNGFRGVE